MDERTVIIVDDGPVFGSSVARLLRSEGFPARAMALRRSSSTRSTRRLQAAWC